MIIHYPEQTRRGSEAILQARVELHRPIENFPTHLWYSFPMDYKNWLSDRADAFAAGLLLPAMHLQEDLEIRAPISTRLLYGLQEIQHIFHLWFPRVFHPIRMHAPQLAEQEPKHSGHRVALAFSGGVDSFYTLFSHLPENQPLQDYRITHCLFVQGFDIPLNAAADYDLSNQYFEDVLKPMGIDLIQCRTNVQAFLAGRVKWVNAYGPAVASTALALGGGLERFYLSATHPYDSLIPTGATPASDHWLSTETLDVIHFGSGLSRVEKLEVLSAWPTARDNLRVCTNLALREGVSNCSRCSKCLRTLTMLKVTGKAALFPTFKQPFTLLHALRWLFFYNAEEPWVEETIQYAAARRKFQYIPLLLLILLVGKVRTFLMRLIPRRLFAKIKAWRYPPEKNPFRADVPPGQENPNDH